MKLTERRFEGVIRNCWMQGISIQYTGWATQTEVRARQGIMLSLPLLRNLTH